LKYVISSERSDFIAGKKLLRPSLPEWAAIPEVNTNAGSTSQNPNLPKHAQDKQYDCSHDYREFFYTIKGDIAGGKKMAGQKHTDPAVVQGRLWRQTPPQSYGRQRQH
jgi:hypothetical protein